MQAHDARILRGAATATALTAALALAASALFAGSAGAMGSALASVIVLGCFGLGQLVVLYAARIQSDLALPASMFGFILKIVVLGVLLVTLGRSAVMDEVNNTAFAGTAALCVVVWLAAQMRGFATAKVTHVDPERSQ